MRFYNILLIGLVILIFVSCSRYIVKVDYESDTDFYEYETFRWIKPKKFKNEQSIFTNSLNQKRFTTAIENELTEKGFKKIEEGQPDLKLIYHIRLEEKLEFASFGYTHWLGHGKVSGYSQFKTYEEGTFIIDIIDANENQLIWRGVAEGALVETDNIEELIYSVVIDLLEDFPPED